MHLPHLPHHSPHPRASSHLECLSVRSLLRGTCPLRPAMAGCYLGGLRTITQSSSPTAQIARRSRRQIHPLAPTEPLMATAVALVASHRPPPLPDAFTMKHGLCRAEGAPRGQSSYRLWLFHPVIGCCRGPIRPLQQRPSTRVCRRHTSYLMSCSHGHHRRCRRSHPCHHNRHMPRLMPLLCWPRYRYPLRRQYRRCLHHRLPDLLPCFHHRCNPPHHLHIRMH